MYIFILELLYKFILTFIPTPKAIAEKMPTLEDVRAVLAVKSQNGMTAEVKGLITKYGGSKLSDVDPKHYADIIRDAEVLGNG